MNEHRFTDAAQIRGARKTQDGYLIAEAFAVRTGVQLYSGSEVGMNDKDVVRVYRPEEEVRNADSLRTFSHAPITMGHPDSVDATNWKDLAKGEVSTEATWDGNKIKLPLIVKDSDAITMIEGGTRELSAGYTCMLDATPGETADGEQYDAVQRNIRINHLAIVPKGRAGSECRIGDDAANWGSAPITMIDKQEAPMPNDLKTVVLGDKAAQVALSDAQIVEQFKADMAKQLSDAQASHDAALAAKDAELAKKDGEIEKLKGQVLSDADLDKRVADRANLVDQARTIAKDVKVQGLSDAEIRKAVVKAKLGDEAVTDKSDAYIEARFDVLVEDAGTVDPVTKALKSGVEKIGDDAGDEMKAYNAYLADFNPQRGAN